MFAPHLKRGHLFPDWDLVLLHISEEANFCGIHYTVKNGNDSQLYCTSPGFLIYASHSVRKGWLVTRFFSHHYTYNVTNVKTHWQVRVQRNNVDRVEPQYVRSPKEAVNGSFFGTCTCGADKTDAVPCEHMAAIAISSCPHPQITPISMMPTWWGREQWRKQFPSDLYCDGSMTMKSIKDGKMISFYITARIGLHQTKVDVQRRLSGVNLALKRQWLKQRVERSHQK